MMWIDSANNYGKEVTWGTTGSLGSILEAALRYANENGWTIDSVSTHIGNTYDEKLVTVEFT
jgi:hypothetical protein